MSIKGLIDQDLWTVWHGHLGRTQKRSIMCTKKTFEEDRCCLVKKCRGKFIFVCLLEWMKSRPIAYLGPWWKQTEHHLKWVRLISKTIQVVASNCVEWNSLWWCKVQRSIRSDRIGVDAWLKSPVALCRSPSRSETISARKESGEVEILCCDPKAECTLWLWSCCCDEKTWDDSMLPNCQFRLRSVHK